ncbi:hypothetical protein G6F50_016153 [Rhizopus delemar]|uniref:Uncharacterized protein n=1 Tax=Rhizopus delemar TaxID=936053 RepID=A0A9P6XV84_9FUNG|nr:hypothetical protein G6F50_016153 [Rhizopus delemar]
MPTAAAASMPVSPAAWCCTGAASTSALRWARASHWWKRWAHRARRWAAAAALRWPVTAMPCCLTPARTAGTRCSWTPPICRWTWKCRPARSAWHPAPAASSRSASRPATIACG